MAEEGTIIQVVEIEEELSRSYVNYAMSVIIARALPDIRDGLKPVQRRILYAMHELGLTSTSATTKCAKVCGQTSGDFHPHGEATIYPTLVRMAQSFTMRYPLIDGQGNFGSVDGDSPAAMRYTECRLTPLAMEMLEDINRETIDWMPNYLQTLNEPTVLPSKFPNLLCNGGQGIAVGMATSLPPHNLTEVCNAILHRIDNPKCDLDAVMEHLPGPDFPTYGLIMGKKGIRDAYETGRGSIIMQAKTAIEPIESGKTAIVITEIPYQVNKTNLVKNIAEIAKTKAFDGITDVQDYSDKLGMRIQVDLRRDVNPNKALNYLLKKTQLRTTFGAIMLSLIDGAPRVSPLLTILDEHIRHRTEVIERRAWFELMRALEEIHLNEGYQIARKNLDEVIKTIRKSKDAGEARVQLVRKFDMSAFQANAVLNLQLRRLTQLAQEELENTYKEWLRKAQDLMDILTNPVRLKKVLKDEVEFLRDKFGDERRTKIIPREAGEFTEEDLIPEEEAIISISRDGYIKRISTDAYRQQKRGGKGMKNVMKAEDEPDNVFQVNTHDYVLFFTNKGKAYKLRAYDIPESSRYAKGMPVINYIAIESDERVTATVNVKEHKGEGFLTMITKLGEIKRTALDSYQNLRSNGLKTFDIEDGDELGWVLKSGGKDDIIIVTHNGQSIRFHEKDVKDRSRTAGGVRAIKLRKNDFIVSADIADNDAFLLVVGENGFGKRTAISEYRVQGRGGSGILTMNCTAKTGKIVGSRMVRDKDKLLVLTSNGKGIRLKVKEIRLVGRVAQGVKLIDLGDGDKVASIAVLVDEDEIQKQTEEPKPKGKRKSNLFDE